MRKNYSSIQYMHLLPFIIKAVSTTEGFTFERTSSDIIEENKKWKNILESGLEEIDFLAEEVPELLISIARSLTCFYEHDQEHEKAYNISLIMGEKIVSFTNSLAGRTLTHDQGEKFDLTDLSFKLMHLMEKIRGPESALKAACMGYSKEHTEHFNNINIRRYFSIYLCTIREPVLIQTACEIASLFAKVGRGEEGLYIFSVLIGNINSYKNFFGWRDLIRKGYIDFICLFNADIRQVFSDYHRHLALVIYLDAGLFSYNQGSIRGAEKIFNKALSFSTEESQISDLNFWLSECYKCLGEYNKSLNLLKTVETEVRESLSIEHNRYLEVTDSLAEIFFLMRYLEHAERVTVDNLKKKQKTYGKNSIEYLCTLKILGMIVYKEGLVEESVGIFFDYIEISLKLNSKDRILNHLTSVINILFTIREEQQIDVLGQEFLESVAPMLMWQVEPSFLCKSAFEYTRKRIYKEEVHPKNRKEEQEVLLRLVLFLQGSEHMEEGFVESFINRIVLDPDRKNFLNKLPKQFKANTKKQKRIDPQKKHSKKTWTAIQIVHPFRCYR